MVWEHWNGYLKKVREKIMFIMFIYGKGILGRKHSQGKGPDVCLAISMNSEEINMERISQCISSQVR